MSIYHFHKDCMYFDKCKLEIVKEGRHKYEVFTCPALDKPVKYYVGDCLRIKDTCPKFVPIMPDLTDFLLSGLIPEGGEEND